MKISFRIQLCFDYKPSSFEVLDYITWLNMMVLIIYSSNSACTMGSLRLFLRSGSLVLGVARLHSGYENRTKTDVKSTFSASNMRSCRGPAGEYARFSGRHFWFPKAAKISIVHKENTHFLYSAYKDVYIS